MISCIQNGNRRMKTRVEPDGSLGTPAEAGLGGIHVVSATEAAEETVENRVYDLRLGRDDSDGFFRDVTEFSERFLKAIERRAGTSIDAYASYVQIELREAERSRGEYELDLLLLGLALGRYLGASEHTSGAAVAFSRELYWLRREARWTKALVDLGRAAIGQWFIAPAIGRPAKPGPLTLERFPRLVDWLQATGEFEQEIRRLNNWKSFLGSLAKDDAERWMRVSVEAFEWFEREAEAALGSYTAGVSEFLSGPYAHRWIREDHIFCGRPRVEYHLAMLATEIMNRGLRERFEKMHKKIVLVPSCMRQKAAENCKAKFTGVDIKCAGCDPSCTINRITQKMRLQGAAVFIVPHSTAFSRWLERWQREPDTGVVAVACLLNILPGGFEMRARRIASQCVPLDSPGCQKHWRRKRVPTETNEERLVQIVAATPGA
jgi:hypothetical protein